VFEKTAHPLRWSPNRLKNVNFLCVIAGAMTYSFAAVGKANVQKTSLFLTALYDPKSKKSAD